MLPIFKQYRTGALRLHMFCIEEESPFAIVERSTYLLRMLKSLTKHSFNIRLNCDVYESVSKLRGQVHITRLHPSLVKSTNTTD